MRLDGFHPTTLPTRPARAAQVPVEPPSRPADAPAARIRAVAAPAERAAATGEYIPARQGPAQPVHGYANQAVASYQSMASLPDADVHTTHGVDLFV